MVKHIVWAAALIAVALVFCFFFAPRHSASSVDVRANELQAAINAIRALPLAHAPISPLDKPAITVIRELVPTAKFTDAELLAFVKALGERKTAPVVHVSANLVGPSPVPVPTVPPDFTRSQARYIYDAAFSADTQALSQSHIAVTAKVSQEPVAPSRFSTTYFSDGAAGLAYAVRRRGQCDLNAAVFDAKGKLEPGATVVYRFRGTSAGLGVGALLGAGRIKPGVTLSISF